MPEKQSCCVPTAIDRWLWLVLGLCVVRLWVMPLPSSLWVDELGTLFVVRHGSGDPSLRVAPQVAESIYYALPALSRKLLGQSEISLRIFSALAMAGALYAIGRISARLLGPDAAWVAVFGCMASRDFNFQASDARPYALGTCVLAFALLALIRWQETFRLRDACSFVLLASLLWRVHLIFWPFYIVFVSYAAIQCAERKRSGLFWRTAAVFALIALLSAPVALRALSLLREAHEHVVAPAPVWADLTRQLRITTITAATTLAFLAARLWRWEQPAVRIAGSSLALIGGWWLIDPVTLYSFSRLTGNSVFLPRYIYLALPGVVLSAVVAVTLAIPAHHLKTAALILGAGVLVFAGRWSHFWPDHTRSDWKGAAQALGRWEGAGDSPVICPSPFVEARPPVWHPGYPLASFLYSHLGFYPAPRSAYTFPFETSPEAEAYARTLASGPLLRFGRFAIYGGERSVRFWREWFAQQPELKGWRTSSLGAFGDVEVAAFEAPRK